jgi:hypothetical protein
MTFDQWLDEEEGFAGPRMYRLMDDINSPEPSYNDLILKWLRAAYEVGAEHAQTYKDGYDAAMRIVKSTYPDKFPDTYFICGEGGEKDQNNLPKRIHVCPAYGVDWIQIYERTDKTFGPEW